MINVVLLSTGEPAAVEEGPPETLWKPQQGFSSDNIPVRILLILSGPGGSRVEEFVYGKRKIELKEMQPGWWSIRADGLREDGTIGWASRLLHFQVKPEKPVAIKLDFQALD